jgi:hypothetical protein
VAEIAHGWPLGARRAAAGSWSRARPAWLIDAAATWFASRLALLALLLFAANLGGFWGHTPAAYIDRWDTEWYVRIASSGYATEQSANFFPLLPLLMAGAARVLTLGAAPSPDQLLVSGLVIANLGALAAFCAMAALVAREESASVASTAVRLLAAFPFAFFFAAAYTEGLFLACSIIAFLAARSGRWWWAVPAGLAAGLLRPTAALLVLPLAWEAWRQANGQLRLRAWPSRLAAVAAPVAGIGLYSGYLWLRFGDPLLFVHTQGRYWHHVLWPFWQTIATAAHNVSQPGAGLAALDLGFALGFLALVIVMAGRLPFACVLYTAGVVLAVLSSPTPREGDIIHSTGRYLLAAFPAFWLVARSVAVRPRLEYALLALGLMLQAGLWVAFLLGGPIY